MPKIDSWSKFPKLGVCVDRPISGNHPDQKVVRSPQPGPGSQEDMKSISSPGVQEKKGARAFWRPTSMDARVRNKYQEVPKKRERERKWVIQVHIKRAE
jgi:hypothetical protein